ncbi:MAG TPA: protein kinase, partial [Gemmatimonadaceae bacterium]|nr:protein kinase [Gemmatimonadaceae bacterium]
MSDVLTRLTTALETRYRIEREVGVGGMATVYLAHDLRHERDVAIKVLHPDLAAALGAERFLAEIKTTAKLQHPHILPLLDSGEAGGLLYYVMPYVAGESLRTRLDRETQLAVDDATRIAREVLSALDYAHRHGVVHRDIKPENILIHEDQALVADFGIALAVSAAGGARMTQTGLSLGTPAYMAPEQAMGERAIDGRADIYALGAVLYEMLVGEAPFTGPTVQAIVARVMTESPRPVTGQRKSVPANVNAAVLRALEKLPADRFHSAAEFSTALVTTSFDSAVAAREETPASTRSTKFNLRASWIPWAVAGVAGAAAIYLGIQRRTGENDKQPTYLAVDLPQDLVIPSGATDGLGVSDDGSMIAFAAVNRSGRAQVYLRSLNNDELRAVDGSAGTRGGIAFSADGQWVVFGANGKVLKASVKGGPATPIANSRWAHLAWAGNDAVIYTLNYNSGLFKVSSEGRDSVTLTEPDRKKGELGHWWPQMLPDGDHVLFTNYTTPADKSKIEVLSLKTGKREVVLDGGYFGRYVKGHLVFVRDAGTMTVPFDIGALKTKGSPVPLAMDVEINPPSGWAAFALSRNGTLVSRTDELKSVAITWADEAGNEEAAVDSVARYLGAEASPDGKKIAVVRDGDVWIYDRQRKLFSRLTQTEQREEYLVWSPDSREIFYVRDEPQYDIFKRSADGSRPEERVVTSPNDKTPRDVSPDGKVLVYEEDPGTGNQDVYAVSPNPGEHGEKRVILGGPGNQIESRFSPDGQWIAYNSDESGRQEVYLSPYPADRGPSRQQVSYGGGTTPRWGADGRTIYYGWNGRIIRARVNPRTGEIGTPETLTKIEPAVDWTTAPDGRFLV